MLKKIVMAVLMVCLFSTAAMAVEVANLTVVNPSPVKVSVFFTTDVACQAKVIYQGPDKVDYLAMEEGVGTVHLVDVKGLNASTPYFYKLKLVDAQGKVLANLVNEAYAFTTPNHGLAMPSSIFGQVVGIKNASVIVNVRSADYKKAYPLFTNIDDKGMWTVNFGDLKGEDGNAMAAQSGDNIDITVIGHDGRVKTEAALVDGNTLQKINDIAF